MARKQGSAAFTQPSGWTLFAHLGWIDLANLAFYELNFVRWLVRIARREPAYFALHYLAGSRKYDRSFGQQSQFGNLMQPSS